MKKLLFSVLSMGLVFGSSFSSYATIDHAPTFVGGHSQSFTICENASAFSLDTLLAITDLDIAQPETWAVFTTAMHGTLVASYISTSTGGTIYPTGLSYTPTTGFSGTDTFSVIITDSILSDTTIVYVTINPLANPGIIIGSSSICIGSPSAFADTIGGGIWSCANANATVSAGVVSGSVPGLDTLLYAVTNSCGTRYATLPLTVNFVPIVDSIYSAVSICVGVRDTLTEASTGGLWSRTNTHATVEMGRIRGISAGIDTIRYTVTNACGTAIASVEITVHPLPIPSVIAGRAAFCLGSTDTLTDSVAGGMWYSINSNATVSGGLVSGVSNGTDTILYVVSNSCGTDTARKRIRIDNMPNGGFIICPDSICITTTPSPTVIFCTGTPGGAWSSSNPAIADAFTVGTTGSFVIGLTPGYDTLYYTINNSCGSARSSWVIKVVNCNGAGVSNVANSFTSQFQVYPNPTTGKFSISLSASENEIVTYTINNLLGEKVIVFTSVTNTTDEMNLNLNSGIYFITAATKIGKQVEKIVITKK